MDKLELEKMREDLTVTLRTEFSKFNNQSSGSVIIAKFHSAIKKLETLKNLQAKRKISETEQQSVIRGDLNDEFSERYSLAKEVNKLLVASNHIQFLQYLKLIELSENFLSLLVKKQFLTSTLVIRALHELTSMVCFLEAEMDKRISRIERQIELPKIQHEVALTVNFLERFYYGSSAQHSSTQNFDIGIGRKYLRKHLKLEREIYDLLCDYVHPNFRSNDIFGDGTLYETILKGDTRKTTTVTIQMVTFFSSYISILDHLLFAFGAKIAFFSKARDRVSDTGVKVPNIFKTTTIRSKNDGKSIENAIDLTNSRDFIDQVEMQFKWLASNKLSYKEKEIIKMGEDEFYDVIITNRGRRYFRLKIHSS